MIVVPLEHVKKFYQHIWKLAGSEGVNVYCLCFTAMQQLSDWIANDGTQSKEPKISFSATPKRFWGAVCCRVIISLLYVQTGLQNDSLHNVA